jgi:ELWxxDGT repeat protein
MSSEIEQLGSLVLFSANNGASGVELWVSEGPASGAHLVQDIFAGSGSSNPKNLTIFNGIVYFAADDGMHGAELWKTDGYTAALVRDLNPYTEDASPSWMVDLNGVLLFSAEDGRAPGDHGKELWKSDGTPGGTALVNNINPGILSSDPEQLTVFNDLVFFLAAMQAMTCGARMAEAALLLSRNMPLSSWIIIIAESLFFNWGTKKIECDRRNEAGRSAGGLSVINLTAVGEHLFQRM